MNTTTENSNPVLSALNTPAILRRRKWRMINDKIVQHSMTVGGISVIIAILLIFFYLLYVVFPLLLPASLEAQGKAFPVPAAEMGETLHLAIEEKNEVGVRFTDQAQAVFFRLSDGKIVKQVPLATEEVAITSFGAGDSSTGAIVYGLEDGRALVVKYDYKITYPNDERKITPEIQYPLGEKPIVIDEAGNALQYVDVQLSEEANVVVAVTADNQFILSGFEKEVDFLSQRETLTRTGGELMLSGENAAITSLLLDKKEKNVYLTSDAGHILHIDISDKTQPKITENVQVVKDTQSITDVAFLTGDISLLVGDSDGVISQWFPVRQENGQAILTRIRQFHYQTAPITKIEAEERRKGFLAIDEAGNLGIYHSTAHRSLLVKPIGETPRNFAISPRADVLVIENQQQEMKVWDVHNEHPEISLSALWGKVWYESHEEPKYIWQSSAANSDYEPKFSLMPLAFGTLKAAFYAMLVSIPLAIFGAVYTAYFMSPGMRSIVKPTIEIMEALPTVILGFLAGLWLAPTVEAHLPGVLILLILLPISIILSAYLWWRLVPKAIKYAIPPGWEAALLIPTVVFVGWLSFALSQPVELWLFEGNTRQWLSNMGIDFDQRNALIVGVAMGLAVIPSIFSITEDAVFSVPKHLTSGSLALGATMWQTMMGVVILTASPGIFSAVMIGLGRAVGETMIVLMATGNTAVMDFSIFEGLRTLSANIAVEIPESEVNSTHYRVLFLSGLVLFIFTFFFNTLAEVVRHRLRRKYSSL